ncbi:MAG: hypothetical protein JSU02_08980 [Bacteroidetes bacterium]|nr:hypothetical protein [Bacteroidota bacterium]
MKAITPTIPLALLISACGSLQETTAVKDDVYDIPDRTATAAAAYGQQAQQQSDESSGDAYYDPTESRQSGSFDRGYYDMAYNDPYYYNYGRFGFGTGIGSYGPGWGMGLSYGWPTSFGSMSLGYGYGSGLYGYSPYWANSWMSGYGYGYDPFGYYGYGNYGYGWGGYGMGYGPYQGPWGGCFNCYEPWGYSNTVYSHRPSMTATSTAGTTTAPRLMRNPAGLLQEAPPARNPAMGSEQFGGSRPTSGDRAVRGGQDRWAAPGRERAPESRPSRQFDLGGSSPSRSGGGSDGGGRISSPRPR